MWQRVGVVFAVVSLAAGPVGAQSLWPKNGGSMFTDHRASSVGDLVTVIVTESVAAQTRSRSSQARSLELDLGGGSGFLSLLPGGAFGGGQGSNASRAVGTSLTVHARVTLRVVQVLPNDVLRLEGDRQLLLRDEPYRLRISGLVRRLDVQADNTVPSDRLADVRIVLEGPRRPFTGDNPIQWILDGFGALLRFLFSWLE